MSEWAVCLIGPGGEYIDIIQVPAKDADDARRKGKERFREIDIHTEEYSITCICLSQ